MGDVDWPAVRKAFATRWDTIAIVAMAWWVLWPVPFEVPRSQDHTVHLARAWMVGQNLAHGHIASWSSTWFFGFPAGELYPVVGDLAVAGVHGLSLGHIGWPQAYAIVFWLGYTATGLALPRIARVLGWGPWPGVIAAALFYLDPGETREGGFRFTVFFGVWLQPLAVACTWWALAELHAILATTPAVARRLLRPLLLGALALLAHPVTLPMATLMTPLLVIVATPRGQRVRAAWVAGVVAAGAFAAAAWFVLPLLAHRAWMANFGALHHGLPRMVDDALAGQWATNMAAPVGWTITAGLIWALVRGERFARFAAVAALALWLLAAQEAFWLPRLDWFAGGFRFLQYQRFVMCAKPGLWLCAGLVLTALVRWAWAQRHHRGRAVATAAALAAWVAWLGHGAIGSAREHGVGEIQLARGGDARTAATFEADWAAYLAWARQQWQARDGFYRFAYETASRHGHGFADAPVFTGAPAFKIGSTPGETFVHRVESNRGSVLDRLRVRYLVTVAGTKGREVARFGTIRVLERPLVDQVARIRGAGTVEIVRDDPDGEGVVVDVRGSAPGDRLEFAIAGYPRWELRHDGRVVEWYEVPVVGDGPIATQAERRAGAFIAGRGDRTAPSEPMLLAADAADGRWELRYRHFVGADATGLALALLVVALALGLHRRGPRFVAAIDRVAAGTRAWMVAMVVAVLAVVAAARWLEGRAGEATLASAWVRSGRATDVVGLRACPLEIQRVIGAAVCVDAAPGETATATFSGVLAQGAALTGYLAVDDAERERARGHATLVVETRAGDGPWTEHTREAFRFASGRHAIAVPLAPGDGAPIDVRVQLVADAPTTPRLGFDLRLQ